ncbi:MAG: NgoPII family restriction endonuclease [Methanobrevibacter sp.]|nr:NgoPII family restriction endonuclease [Methanobrevibacter sp.]
MQNLNLNFDDIRISKACRECEDSWKEKDIIYLKDLIQIVF